MQFVCDTLERFFFFPSPPRGLTAVDNAPESQNKVGTDVTETLPHLDTARNYIPNHFAVWLLGTSIFFVV